MRPQVLFTLDQLLRKWVVVLQHIYEITVGFLHSQQVGEGEVEVPDGESNDQADAE
jgi:hypothetical protein